MRHTNAIFRLASGAVLLSGLLVQPLHANLLNESGVSTLADALGVNSPPEALTISWSVVESPSFLYTYSYTINNPAGDVLLPGSGNPGQPEVVDSYQVDFNTGLAGALVGLPSVGGYDIGNGIVWFLSSPVTAGNSSAALTYQSDLPPTMGNASASDDNPPSPWSSYPSGEQIPVPGAARVPDSTSTAVLLGGIMILFPFRTAFRKVARK